MGREEVDNKRELKLNWGFPFETEICLIFSLQKFPDFFSHILQSETFLFVFLT